MTKGFKKKQSKRMPAKRRYKIERAVRDHNKKLRKLSKKQERKAPKKKDPGVPNEAPFKLEIISETERHKRSEIDRKKVERELAKKRREEGRDKFLELKRGLNSDILPTLDQLKSDAEKRDLLFLQKQKLLTGQEPEPLFADGRGKIVGVLRPPKQFHKEFDNVIQAADVIIHVLDARDPLGSRCVDIEEAVIKAGPNKRLILLLNKIDLVPRQNLQGWLKYLRNEWPTVAFRANKQSKQRNNLGRSNVEPLQSSEPLLGKKSLCIGANALLRLLSNYCRNKDIKQSITVGVVGFPNVGKSSVINSLKRSKVCATGAIPGMTTTLQTVQLNKHIKLIDSPGVVFAKANDSASHNRQMEAFLALRNAISIKKLSDPEKPVEAILSRINRDDIMRFYKVPHYDSALDFLTLLAKKAGKLNKHGIPRISEAAEIVLTDWNTGRIKYFTEPPESHLLPSHLSAEIVTEMGKDFDLHLYTVEQEMKDLSKEGFNPIDPNSAHIVESTGMLNGGAPVEADDQNEDDEDAADDMISEDEDAEDVDMSEDGANEKDEALLKQSTTIRLLPSDEKKIARKRHLREKALKDMKQYEEKELGGMQLNKERKVAFKKMKKLAKRKEKVATKLSDSLDAALSLATGSGKMDEDYDFKSNFNLK